MASRHFAEHRLLRHSNSAEAVTSAAAIAATDCYRHHLQYPWAFTGAYPEACSLKQVLDQEPD